MSPWIFWGKIKGSWVHFGRCGTDLLAAVPADGCPVAHAGPESVAAAEEAREELTPAAAQRPGEDLVLVLFLILLHVVRQVPAGWRGEKVR